MRKEWEITDRVTQSINGKEGLRSLMTTDYKIHMQGARVGSGPALEDYFVLCVTHQEPGIVTYSEAWVCPVLHDVSCAQRH